MVQGLHASSCPSGPPHFGTSTLHVQEESAYLPPAAPSWPRPFRGHKPRAGGGKADLALRGKAPHGQALGSLIPLEGTVTKLPAAPAEGGQGGQELVGGSVSLSHGPWLSSGHWHLPGALYAHPGGLSPSPGDLTSPPRTLGFREQNGVPQGELPCKLGNAFFRSQLGGEEQKGGPGLALASPQSPRPRRMSRDLLGADPRPLLTVLGWGPKGHRSALGSQAPEMPESSSRSP